MFILGAIIIPHPSLIIPTVGRGREREVQATIDAYRTAARQVVEWAPVDRPILRIGLSGFSPLEHYRLGQCIAQAVDALDRRAVLVASGDLSHKLRDDGPYGFAPEGPEFDRQITEAMAEGDFLHFLTMDPALCDRAAEQCHVEVTTLLIPGENDSEEEIRSLTRWLASVERVYRLADVARGCLSFVYTGNC